MTRNVGRTDQLLRIIVGLCVRAIIRRDDQHRVPAVARDVGRHAAEDPALDTPMPRAA